MDVDMQSPTHNGRRFIDSDLEAVLLKRIHASRVFSKQLRDVGTIDLQGPRSSGPTDYRSVVAAAKRFVLPPNPGIPTSQHPAFDLASLRGKQGPGP